MTGEERRKARSEKLRARSEKKGKESTDAMDREREISRNIPMGQPILIGHHSEGRHRRDISRMQKLGTKAYQAADESKDLGERADRVEKSSSVSIQDDDAVKQIKKKIQTEETQLDFYRRVRKAWMKEKKPSHEDKEAYLRIADRANLSEKERISLEIRRDVTEDRSWDKCPISTWEITNLNANLKRNLARLEDLERVAGKSGEEKLGSGSNWTAVIDWDEVRANIVFEDKPVEEVRAVLKRNGFKWSPTRGAWTRKATANGIASAKRVMEKIS